MTKRSKRQYKNKWDRAMHDYTWMGDDDGYEYSGGPGKRLRRNKIDGVLGGVCAGIGDYFDLDPVVVRIAYVASVMLGFPIFIYFILWVFVPADKRAPYHREYRQARKARRKNPDNPAPTATYRDVKGKFRSLEQRLQDLEKSITSSEWQLRRDFRDLESK